MDWITAALTATIQCVVAVAAGRMISLLPERPIQLVAAGLFRDSRSGWRAAGASVAVLFAAEWGDLSQLFTAGLVAKGEPPLAVFVGSLAALVLVSGLAVLLGRVLLRRVRLSLVRYVAAAICAGLAVITLVGAL